MLRQDFSLAENALGFWVTLTLLILSVTSLALRYVTSPISCMTPAEAHGSFVRYAHDVCYRSKLYYVSMDEDIPVERGDIIRAESTQHHWVPFYLGVAALGCLAPYVIWRMLSGLLWIDAHVFAQTVSDNQRQNASGRHVMLRDSALLLKAGLKGGNYMLTAAMIARKLFAGIICLIQLVLIVEIWDPQLDKLKEEGDGEEDGESRSQPLPLHVYCDFSVRQLQTIQRYTLQCMLTHTPVYSKGFTFLFYLFLLLLLACAADVLLTLCRVGVPVLRDVSIRRYMNVIDPSLDPQLSAILPRFLDTLGVDGRLVLAVVADCCGPLAAADLTNHLWQIYRAGDRPHPLPTQAPPTGGPVQHFNQPAPPASSQAPPSVAASAPYKGADGGDGFDGIPLLPVGEGKEEKTPV